MYFYFCRGSYGLRIQNNMWSSNRKDITSNYILTASACPHPLCQSPCLCVLLKWPYQSNCLVSILLRVVYILPVHHCIPAFGIYCSLKRWHVLKKFISTMCSYLLSIFTRIRTINSVGFIDASVLYFSHFIQSQ